MSTAKVLLAILSAFRLTSFLVYERWTEKLRMRAGVDFEDENGYPITFWGKVLGCFWCTSLLTSVVTVAIAYTALWWLLLPLGVSAAVILLNHIARIYLYMER